MSKVSRQSPVRTEFARKAESAISGVAAAWPPMRRIERAAVMPSMIGISMSSTITSKSVFGGALHRLFAMDHGLDVAAHALQHGGGDDAHRVAVLGQQQPRAAAVGRAEAQRFPFDVRAHHRRLCHHPS